MEPASKKLRTTLQLPTPMETLPQAKPTRAPSKHAPISERDCQNLFNSNRALWIAFPESCRLRSNRQLATLEKFVAESSECSDVSSVTRSAGIFLAVLYKTTAHRDTAVESLRLARVGWKGGLHAPIVAPFAANSDPQTWSVSLGPFATPKLLSAALEAFLLAHNKDHKIGALGYNIRRLFTMGLPTSTFMVRAPHDSLGQYAKTCLR